jgi:hypothetical protein
MDEISFHPYYAPPPAKDTSGESPVSARNEPADDQAAMRARAARETVHATEPGRTVYSAQPLTDALSATLSQQQFRTLLVGAFSALALTLATIGLYGVMTCSVSLPTREFGIRLALGTTRPPTRRASRRGRAGRCPQLPDQSLAARCGKIERLGASANCQAIKSLILLFMGWLAELDDFRNGIRTRVLALEEVP